MKILQVVEEEGGEAKTSTVRPEVSFEDTVLYHAKPLFDEELLEVSRKVQEREGQRPTKVLRITEEGREAVADGLTERVRPSMVEKQLDLLESDIETIEEQVEKIDHEQLEDDVELLRDNVSVLKREVQKRALEGRVEDIEQDIETLFARVDSRATEERVEEVAEELELVDEKYGYYRDVLQELATAAAARTPNHDDRYTEFRKLLSYMVAVEQYLEGRDIDIWQYHPGGRYMGDEHE